MGKCFKEREIKNNHEIILENKFQKVVKQLKKYGKNQRIKEFIFPTGLQFPHWININLATFSQQHVHLKIFSFVAQYTLV